MRVGIEKINLYAGRCYLDILDLAEARGADLEYLRTRVMCERRTIVPLFEDSVTLAVNAARRTLAKGDTEDIELVIVGTESAVDFGKPISNWVHRYCGLPANCRSFEIKHACYSGTAALKMAAAWIASGARPGKKALVVCTDFSRPAEVENVEIQVKESVPELITGGGAVAMIVGAEPRVAELELDKVGYWTNEIDDSWRPTSRAECGDQLKSLYSYLDALDGAYDHYEEVAGPLDYDAAFKKHIYHAPFPGMTLQAHLSLLGRLGIDKAAATRSFQQKVGEGLCFTKRVGSIYGASTFVSLLGLLHAATDLKGGDRVSMFAYGAGCQGELSSLRIGEEACAYVRSHALDRELETRERVSVAQYEEIERLRLSHTDLRDFRIEHGEGGLFERAYRGKQLLVLDSVDGFRRNYGWS